MKTLGELKYRQDFKNDVFKIVAQLWMAVVLIGFAVIRVFHSSSARELFASWKAH